MAFLELYGDQVQIVAIRVFDLEKRVAEWCAADDRAEAEIERLRDDACEIADPNGYTAD